MRRLSRSLILATLAALALGLAGCDRLEGLGAGDEDPTAQASTRQLPGQADSEREAAPLPAIAEGTLADVIPDVAERAVPSVVNISTTKRIAAPQQQLPFFNDPFFRHFFGDPRRGGPPQGPRGYTPQERLERSLGSGVIVREEGVVLTNNHVVAQADDILVGLNDGRELQAELVGSDPRSDLAVLKLKEDVEGLVPLALGDSDALRLGETVLAIGNPFGVGQTVTQGIVSALGRADLGIVDYEDFIQTDAAINPGNSGGALVNLRGELVGINTAIVSRTGGYQGIGFAIPANMVSAILADLLDDGEVSRGFLGVMIQDLTPDLAEAMGLERRRGVVVADLVETGPAREAGLEPGDVILRLNGAEVRKSSDLRNRIAAAGPETEIELEVLREGDTKTLTVELAELPTEGGAPARARESSGADGLQLAPVDEARRRGARVPSGLEEGAAILDVEPGSRYARAGLRPGDIIVQVGRVRVSSPSEAEEALDAAGAKTFLRVIRGGRSLFVVLPAG